MKKRYLINNQIRAGKVRVIDEKGKNLGIFNLEKAIQLAKERELDLVQITKNVEPPVCKIIDYGKYLYSQKKKLKKGPKKGEVKGIRLTLGISSHDMETKIKQVERFLKEGNKVKIEMRLRGREKTLEDFAEKKLFQFLEALKEGISFKKEGELKKEKRGLIIVISPE